MVLKRPNRTVTEHAPVLQHIPFLDPGWYSGHWPERPLNEVHCLPGYRLRCSSAKVRVRGTLGQSAAQAQDQASQTCRSKQLHSPIHVAPLRRTSAGIIANDASRAPVRRSATTECSVKLAHSRFSSSASNAARPISPNPIPSRDTSPARAALREILRVYVSTLDTLHPSRSDTSCLVPPRVRQTKTSVSRGERLSAVARFRSLESTREFSPPPPPTRTGIPRAHVAPQTPQGVISPMLVNKAS